MNARGGLGEARPDEDIVYCGFSDKVAIEAMVEGCDGIVRLGGRPDRAGGKPIEVYRNSVIRKEFETALIGCAFNSLIKKKIKAVDRMRRVNSRRRKRRKERQTRRNKPSTR
jgi:hypothetical protein